ncbi:hypothetical protein TNCV_4678041 [Trichonephila clavipes]|nr:hypothetical protein TNCV_4678041 [Trichonephila clavipes]
MNSESTSASELHIQQVYIRNDSLSIDRIESGWLNESKNRTTSGLKRCGDQTLLARVVQQRQTSASERQPSTDGYNTERRQIDCHGSFHSTEFIVMKYPSRDPPHTHTHASNKTLYRRLIFSDEFRFCVLMAGTDVSGEDQDSVGILPQLSMPHLPKTERYGLA